MISSLLSFTIVTLYARMIKRCGRYSQRAQRQKTPIASPPMRLHLEDHYFPEVSRDTILHEEIGRCASLQRYHPRNLAKSRGRLSRDSIVGPTSTVSQARQKSQGHNADDLVSASKPLRNARRQRNLPLCHQTAASTSSLFTHNNGRWNSGFLYEVRTLRDLLNIQYYRPALLL